MGRSMQCGGKFSHFQVGINIRFFFLHISNKPVMKFFTFGFAHTVGLIFFFCRMWFRRLFFFLFFFLAILEDSGYMARAAFVMDRLMRALGLPGKAFVPLLVGFGWAKPVPVDMRYFKKPKQGMAITALAGPVSNLLLAMLLLLGARITIAHYVDTAFCSGLLNFLAMTAYMSVGLGLFNLIPISPLDGSKVLFAFLPDRAYMTLMRYEKYGMLVLFMLVWLGVGNNILSEGIYRVYELLVNWIVY